jgi:hypothetical protein
MQNQYSTKILLVQRLSHLARWACWLLYAVTSINATILLAALFKRQIVFTYFNSLWPAIPLALLLFGFVLTGVWLMERLCRHYSRGEIFERRSVRYFKWLGIWLISFEVAKGYGFPAWRVEVLQSAWKLYIGAGAQLHPYETDWSPVVLLLGAFLFVVGWIMELGAEIKAENDVTI